MRESMSQMPGIHYGNGLGPGKNGERGERAIYYYTITCDVICLSIIFRLSSNI